MNTNKTNEIEFDPRRIRDQIRTVFAGHAPHGWYLAGWVDGRPLYLKKGSEPIGVRRTVRNLEHQENSHV